MNQKIIASTVKVYILIRLPILFTLWNELSLNLLNDFPLRIHISLFEHPGYLVGLKLLVLHVLQFVLKDYVQNWRVYIVKLRKCLGSELNVFFNESFSI